MADDAVKQRDPFFDIIKGIAIILVLIGHVIQFGSGFDYQESGAFYNNALFKIIYSFHMPLFMVVSGYLFYHSITSRSFWSVVWKRISTLVVPVFSFALIVWLAQFNPQYSIFDQVRNYLSVTRFTLWFLWALFYSSMGVLIGHYLFKDNLFVWLILILASFLTPDKWFSEMYKYTFPCFLFGYYAHKHNWLGYLGKNIRWLLPICGIIFIVCLLFYNNDCFVYLSGCNILQNGIIDFRLLGLDLFRIFVGILGSIVFIALLQLVYSPLSTSKIQKILVHLGICSMGIYCFQNYFFLVLNQYLWHGIVEWDTWTGVLINRLICFIMVLGISYGLTLAFKKIRILNILFLGGR